MSNLLLGGEMEHHLFGVLNLITGHYTVFRYVSLSSLKNNSDAHQLIFQVVFLSLKHSIMELSSTSQVCISFCGVFCYIFPEATSPPPRNRRFVHQSDFRNLPRKGCLSEGCRLAEGGKGSPWETCKEELGEVISQTLSLKCGAGEGSVKDSAVRNTGYYSLRGPGHRLRMTMQKPLQVSWFRSEYVLPLPLIADDYVY